MARAAVRTGGSGSAEYGPLDPDIYYMRVREADITLSSFKDKDDNDQYQLALVWEVSRLTEEQKEAGCDDSRWVRQWLSLYYGETRNGPSKLKVLIDSLVEQGFLEEFDPATGEIDSDWFVGIEQRVTLAVKGDYNNVVMVSPLKRGKAAKAQTAEPAPRKNTPVRATARNSAPVATADEDEEEDLF